MYLYHLSLNIKPRLSISIFPVSVLWVNFAKRAVAFSTAMVAFSIFSSVVRRGFCVVFFAFCFAYNSLYRSGFFATQRA